MNRLKGIGAATRDWVRSIPEKLITAWRWLEEHTATWLWVLLGLGLVAAGPVSAWWMFRRQIGTILDPETVDFLQVAANVAAGKGLKTFVLRPLGLTPNFAPELQPDLYHPPLPSILWGAAFALRGQPDERIAVLLAGLLIGTTTGLLFFLTTRLVNRWAALIASALFLAAPLTLAVGGMGQATALAVFLFTLWVAFLTRKAVWDKNFAVLSGALLGLTGLASGLALLAAPLALLSRRWISRRERIWFLIALLVILLPYAWRNYRLTGIPLTPLKSYAMLLDTRTFPGDSVFRHTFESRPSPIVLTVQNAGAVIRKGIVNFRRLDRFGASFGWFVILGTLTSLVWWRRWRGTFLRLVTAVTLGTGAICIFVLVLTRPLAESLFFLLPSACLLTAANVMTIAERILETRWWQWLTRPLLNRPYWVWFLGRVFPAFSLGAILIAVQGLVGLLFMKRIVPIRWDPSMQAVPLAEGLMAAHKGQSLLASDEPRLLAYRIQKPVLWLPCHQEDWQRLKLTEKVTHIWLSPGALLQVGGDADTLLRRTVLTGLPFLDRYYPTVLRGPRYLLPTSFLIVGKPMNNRPRFDKSIETMSIDELIGKALEHQKRKEYDQAERLLFAALHKNLSRLDTAKILYHLGGIWIERERYPLAIQAFQAILGELPGNFAAANNLAWSYLQLYDQLSRLPEPPPFLGTILASAERWAEQALATCPPKPEILAHVLDTAGWVDFLQGKTKAGRGQDRFRLLRALKRLEEAYRLLPDNKLIREHLAAVYTELGMNERAEELLSSGGRTSK